MTLLLNCLSSKNLRYFAIERYFNRKIFCEVAMAHIRPIYCDFEILIFDPGDICLFFLAENRSYILIFWQSSPDVNKCVHFWYN